MMVQRSHDDLELKHFRDFSLCKRRIFKGIMSFLGLELFFKTYDGSNRPWFRRCLPILWLFRFRLESLSDIYIFCLFGASVILYIKCHTSWHFMCWNVKLLRASFMFYFNWHIMMWTTFLYLFLNQLTMKVILGLKCLRSFFLGNG